MAVNKADLSPDIIIAEIVSMPKIDENKICFLLILLQYKYKQIENIPKLARKLPPISSSPNTPENLSHKGTPLG